MATTHPQRARKKTWQEQKTKDLIRAQMLLNRLVLFSEGGCEMSAAQVQAAKIVIGKAIPDLKAIEHRGSEDAPIQSRVVVEFVGCKNT